MGGGKADGGEGEPDADAAGNAGPGTQTIGSPAVAKNVIATGASQNNRFDFLIYSEGEDAMADFSSRGPADDGRWPFRVIPADGTVTQDYTSHLQPAVRLFDALAQRTGNPAYASARDRASTHRYVRDGSPITA